MKRTAMKPSTTAMKRTPFVRTQRIEAREVTKLRTVPARKASKTTAERVHLAAVAALGCCLCLHLGLGATTCEVHHVRLNHGWGRSGHFATIGLCPFHHRGQPGGVHDFGREEFTAHYGISEIELLDAVTHRLAINIKTEEP